MMKKIVKPKRQFVSKNQSGEAAPLSTEAFMRPRLPWAMRKGDRIGSRDGREFLLQNPSGTLRYLGSDGKLGRFPAWYYKDDAVYKYQSGCAEVIEAHLEEAVESACGEVLGWFDVPKDLADRLELLLKSSQSKLLKDWVIESMKENLALFIKQEKEGGVVFRIDLNGDYPTPYGGYGCVEITEPNGGLLEGLTLSVRANQLIEMRRLGPFIRSEASVRVTRSKKDQRQAVLTWSSVAWEGSVMTMATIKGL